MKTIQVDVIKLLLNLPRPLKSGLVVFADLFFCIASVWIAYFLRTGRVAFEEFISYSNLWFTALMSIFLALPIFGFFGLYKAIYRYSGIPYLLALFKSMLVYSMVFLVFVYFVSSQSFPHTLGLIEPLVLFVLVAGSRLIVRVVLSDSHEGRGSPFKSSVLIYGAGSAGRQLASAMQSVGASRVLGFLDDAKELQGRYLNGLQIFDPVSIEALIKKLNVTEVLLAIPSATRRRRNEVLASLEKLHLTVRSIPAMSDLVSGKVVLEDVLELSVDDLLGRDVVEPIEHLLTQNSKARKVLVTGAGGSIGAELCRQILKAKPKSLLLIDHSEQALYQLHQELLNTLEKLKAQPHGSTLGIDTQLIPILGSVTDEGRMHHIMKTFAPEVVYHAAAYKHVPLVEQNVVEGLKNNLWGTWVCANAAKTHGIEHFVLISTDKAVRPTNIMGASKRLAEMVLQALADEIDSQHPNHSRNVKTRFSMVRFGNVLGSSGSVVPLFKEQIRQGGPITLTHKDITRYFMSIPEAAQLVIQAGALGKGGDVFVLDMGQPIRIYDLAKRMVDLSGLTLKTDTDVLGDIEIQITGLRPGEKLFEELLIGNDPQATEHPKIFKAHEQFLNLEKLKWVLQDLERAMLSHDIQSITQTLSKFVHGYAKATDVVDRMDA